MEIGLTCTTIEPELTSGKIDGIGVYTKNLLEQFTKLQLEVTPHSFPSFRKRIKTSAFPNGKILPLPYTANTITSLIKPTRLDKKIDLLHVTDHMVPRIKNLPVIATIHDALMFSHPEWYKSKLRRIKNWLRKESFQWANHFITVSYSMIPELVKYLGIKENNISVVHNGISSWWQENVSAEIKKATLQKLGLPEKFILHTGTLQPKKNAIRVIQAFMQLPEDIRREYPLVIAGKAGWDATEILTAIQKLKMQGNGYWLNYVSNDDLRTLYQCASLYMCPSLHEGFGYTLLEAFTSKTPAITSNISALPEVGGDAAYFVDPYSVSEIKTAMQNVLSSEKLRAELIEKGSERAKEFSLEKCATQTLKVYEKIL